MVTHNRDLVKRYPGRMMVCENGTLNEIPTEMEISMDDILV